jgi:hypothetical protein
VQAEVALDLGDGSAGLHHVAERLPDPAVVADAVDHDVDVLAGRVAVGDEQRPVVGEAHAVEHAVDRLAPTARGSGARPPAG